MRFNGTTEPNKRTVRDVFFLLAVAVALGLGLGLASPAFGAGLAQSAGDISGVVTVTGGNAAGITVELRQRSNGGEEKVLATTATDSTGSYHFPKQPSAPNDAFYYIKLTGGPGTLVAWYTFPIIYLSGSDFTVPGVEMSDVQLLLPPGSHIDLPSSLQWRARRSGETYRVFVYAEGKTDKAVLDSGSLGMSIEFPLAEGSLAEGQYEAVVQVRDAVVGYGQSQAHFHFTVGKSAPANQPPSLGVGGSSQEVPTAAAGQESREQPAPEATATTEPPAAAEPAPAQPQPQPQQPAGDPETQSQPDLQLDLSANRGEIAQGESMIYKIEVTNRGGAVASGVVVTDKVPQGVTVDPSTTRSTHGSIAVEGNNVTVQIGDLAPNVKAVVEIPVSVSKEAGTNLSNQATAQYQGSPAPVSSNAYIAQVAAPLSGPPASQPQQPPAAPQSGQPQTAPQAPVIVPPAAQPKSQPAAPAAKPPASSQQAPPAQQPQAPVKKPASSMPQTGGSFPIVFALLLLLVTLVARYLRGRSYRRV